MIVECESCHTRFRLAEERIPAAGAKVRCSRCKTAFIVQRPGVSRDQQIAEVVAEATSPGASRTPEATQDVFETTGSATMTLSGNVEAAAADEEKWEFDEEPRAGASPPASAARASAQKPAESAETDDLDALGSPEDWDLLGNGARRIAEEARFTAPSAPAAPPQAVPAPPVEERRVASPRSVESALAAAVAESAPASEAPGWATSLRAATQSGVDGAVWIAAVVLCVAGLGLSLSPLSAATATQPTAPTAVFEGKRLEITLHAVESGVGGVLAVVRGRLPADAKTNQPQRLRAAWLDAEGAPIAGASAIAGPPIATRELRELSPERVRAAHEARALEVMAGGAFEAVFASLPADGASLSLTRERVPTPAPVVTQEDEGAAMATDSSRPSGSPSSE